MEVIWITMLEMSS